ncbi:MAG: hypothetical protein CMK89_17985 [Pseudomonadales bacterium]|nr:hypothetical protein [Pseudomonadales bacterium]
MSKHEGIPLAWLAWCAALLPLLTTHTTYLVAANYELVHWCVPYWDSCTSISATGRQLPAKYIFKLGMIPAALLTALLWWALWQWGRSMGVRSTIWMPVLGVVAALCLILYTLALGEVGDGYRLLRRIGVVFAFAFTFIAQVLLTRQTLMISLRQPDFGFGRDYRWMLRVQLVLLSIGMTSVILDGIMGDAYDAIEDAFEWWMALLLNGYFVLVARMLQKTSAVLFVST